MAKRESFHVALRHNSMRDLTKFAAQVSASRSKPALQVFGGIPWALRLLNAERLPRLPKGYQGTRVLG